MYCGIGLARRSETLRRFRQPPYNRYSFISNILPVSATESIFCETTRHLYIIKSNVSNILAAMTKNNHRSPRFSKSFDLNILTIKSLESRFCKPSPQRLASNRFKINILEILILKNSYGGLLDSLQPCNQLLRQTLIRFRPEASRIRPRVHLYLLGELNQPQP